MGAALILAALDAPAQAPDASPAEIAAFVGADANADLHLDPDEFRTFIAAMAETGQSTAQTVHFFGAYELAFGIVDANKDGRLSPVELRSADNDHRSPD